MKKYLFSLALLLSVGSAWAMDGKLPSGQGKKVSFMLPGDAESDSDLDVPLEPSILAQIRANGNESAFNALMQNMIREKKDEKTTAQIRALIGGNGGWRHMPELLKNVGKYAASGACIGYSLYSGDPKTAIIGMWGLLSSVASDINRYQELQKHETLKDTLINFVIKQHEESEDSDASRDAEDDEESKKDK